MPHFSDLEAKFGEVAAQAILENLERFEGVRGDAVVPLEQRWHSLIESDAAALVA